MPQPIPIPNGYRANQQRVRQNASTLAPARGNVSDLLRKPPKDLLEAIRTGGIQESGKTPAVPPEFYDYSNPFDGSETMPAPRKGPVGVVQPISNANGLQQQYNAPSTQGSNAMPYRPMTGREAVGLLPPVPSGRQSYTGFTPNMLGQRPQTPMMQGPAMSADAMNLLQHSYHARQFALGRRQPGPYGTPDTEGAPINEAYLRGFAQARPQQANQPYSLQTNQQSLLAGTTPNITVGGGYRLNQPSELTGNQPYRNSGPLGSEIISGPSLNEPRPVGSQIQQLGAPRTYGGAISQVGSSGRPQWVSPGTPDPQYYNADGRAMLNDPKTLEARSRQAALNLAGSPGSGVRMLQGEAATGAQKAAGLSPQRAAEGWSPFTLQGAPSPGRFAEDGPPTAPSLAVPAAPPSGYTAFTPPAGPGTPMPTLRGPMTDPETVAANLAKRQQTMAERQAGVQRNAVGDKQMRDQRIASRNYVPTLAERYAMQNPEFALKAMDVMGENQARAGQLDLARQGLALNRDKLQSDQQLANNQLSLGRDKLAADSAQGQRSHELAMEQARASFQHMVNQGATQQEATKAAQAHYAATLEQMKAQSAQQQRQHDLSLAQGNQQHEERMKQYDLSQRQKYDPDAIGKNSTQNQAIAQAYEEQGNHKMAKAQREADNSDRVKAGLAPIQYPEESTSGRVNPKVARTQLSENFDKVKDLGNYYGGTSPENLGSGRFAPGVLPYVGSPVGALNRIMGGTSDLPGSPSGVAASTFSPHQQLIGGAGASPDRRAAMMANKLMDLQERGVLTQDNIGAAIQALGEGADPGFMDYMRNDYGKESHNQAQGDYLRSLLQGQLPDLRSPEWADKAKRVRGKTGYSWLFH
jgi:hypothetical protein